MSIPLLSSDSSSDEGPPQLIYGPPFVKPTCIFCCSEVILTHQTGSSRTSMTFAKIISFLLDCRARLDFPPRTMQYGFAAIEKANPVRGGNRDNTRCFVVNEDEVRGVKVRPVDTRMMVGWFSLSETTGRGYLKCPVHQLRWEVFLRIKMDNGQSDCDESPESSELEVSQRTVKGNEAQLKGVIQKVERQDPLTSWEERDDNLDEDEDDRRGSLG